jgi:ADP-heptose:LPS heptosyltransferase
MGLNSLVLHAGALGDCVLALHLIAAMKQAWGDPRVTVAARSSIVKWAKRLGFIDEAWSLEEIGAHRLYNPSNDMPERTVERRCSFEHLVSFLGGPSEVVSKRLEEVFRREVIAVDPRPSQSAQATARHIVQQWADQLRGHGLPIEVSTSAHLELRDRPVLHRALRSRIGGGTGRIVLCHPGSGGLAKCCPLEALEGLVGALKEQGWLAAWMIGPDEMERFGADYARRLERTAPVIYEESVEIAADLVAGADAFIGHDAGMTHVAALAGVRTLALFGPTDPAVWRPLGPNCRVVLYGGNDRSADEVVSEVMSGVAP